MEAADNLEVLELIDSLEDCIEKSSTIPLSQKTLINKDEILEIIKQIRIKLPDELKKSRVDKTRKAKDIDRSSTRC